METKYPTLRRPKRKLCYLTNKESVSKQWAGTATLGDVDRMFDDLDSSSLSDVVLASSPQPRRSRGDKEASLVPQKGDPAEKHSQCQKGPEGNVPITVTRSTSPKLEIDSDVLFKMDGPVKTSSPIEAKEGVVDGGGLEEEDNERIPIVSPILFDCEEDGNKEAKTRLPNVQEPQCNGDDSELQTPPSKVTLRKPTMSTHKEGKGLKTRQHNADEPAAPEKLSSSAHSQAVAETSARAGKDMSVFLQKLRDAGQSKPACHKKSLTPVKVAVPPPEPEDDFRILEDDAPLWFTIPSKTATGRRQRQSRSSSTDKESSTDKGTKDSPEEAKAELAIEPVDQTQEKTKKKNGRVKKNEVTRPENDKEELTSPEDLPAGDTVEQEKPNKKKRELKKIPSKECDKAEEEPKETARKETVEEKNAEKMETKVQKSSKDGRGNAKMSRTKPPKRTRKVTRGPEDVKEMVCDEAVKEPSEDQNNEKQAEDWGSNSDKEIMNLHARTANDSAHGKARKDSLPAESPISGRRKRKPTGQWWLCSPETTEETNNWPTHNRSKQHDAEPGAAEPSPVKKKKDSPLKKRDRRRPAPSSSQTTTQAKEKKTQRNKKRPARGDAHNKTKAAEEVPNTSEEEQQQQDVPDQDPDPEWASPFVSTHTDHSLSSGDRVIQKVYHRTSNEKLSNTPAPVRPERPPEPLTAVDPEKRTRITPRSWWTVNDMSKEEQSISSLPQLPRLKEPKSGEKTNKRSKTKPSRSPGLRTPKNGNVTARLKPLGGAHVLLQKLKPMCTPKTVKRSLATFKDIFMSASETPTTVSGRNASQRNTLSVAACTAEEAPATYPVTQGRAEEDGNNVNAGEFRSTQNSPPNQDVLRDDRCHPENTLEDLMSGPSSWSTEPNQYETSDNLILPPSSVPAAHSLPDFCPPPLRPLILQPKDKSNLTEWFKSLWSSTGNKGSEITPDHFDWFFYQGRALGVLVDLNCGSFCNGKILLGSKSKKPLWVDHFATTVFNLLTSSVKVTVNGKKTLFDPGQSFMVQCGRAYSIENVTAQPAVLYFTRLLAESSD
ncbi:uncharacterized protein si:ch211-161h7.4 isoform X2 [Scophthalmus maximus]|uniref:Mif2/CENP-C cupin domain-containing protein n=1 Tax=Scophthalmus maximus TaxID=52904 RepID=A0A8D3ASC1_SCOMX|nr:uncharacterized protein si:ch211-161h7.4 isoform X2 [Scophthalmus maximus]